MHVAEDPKEIHRLRRPSTRHDPAWAVHHRGRAHDGYCPLILLNFPTEPKPSRLGLPRRGLREYETGPGADGRSVDGGLRGWATGTIGQGVA